MAKKTLPAEIVCGNCGSLTANTHANRKYCPPCAEKSRSRQLPHLIDNARRKAKEYQDRKRRERGAALFAGHIIKCLRCSVEFPRKGAGQKYCETCGPIAAKERDRRLEARRVRPGRIKVGEIRPCKQCGEDFRKEGVHQVYCNPECKSQWWAENPQWVINRRMSAAINGSLRDGKNGKSWQALVPYTLTDLMEHLERQFLPHMGWHNRSDWHVDHIVPLSSFNIIGPDCPEFQAAWALTNLRPLWAHENLAKSDKRTHLI